MQMQNTSCFAFHMTAIMDYPFHHLFGVWMRLVLFLIVLLGVSPLTSYSVCELITVMHTFSVVRNNSFKGTPGELELTF